jgi:hypothetical protein
MLFELLQLLSWKHSPKFAPGASHTVRARAARGCCQLAVIYCHAPRSSVGGRTRACPRPRCPSRAIIARMIDEGAFWRGAALFDRGDYFEAHEVWEERWLSTGEPNERLLLQGLIQVAAAFHKLIVSRSLASAERLLDRGLTKLTACDPASVPSFELTVFCRALHACKLLIADESFDRAQIPRMKESGA